jgi:hypothetical protein
MQVQNNSRQNPATNEQDIYTFIREDNLWYIHLPSFLDSGWNKPELRMAEGAPKFLNFLSNGSKHLRLWISTQPQEGAGILE